MNFFNKHQYITINTGTGQRRNGKNVAEVCCACGGGKKNGMDLKKMDSSDAYGTEEKQGQEEMEEEDEKVAYLLAANITCGCPSSCTSDILDTDVGDVTIAQQISWIVDNLGESEIDACELVCGEEFDEICGKACNPSQCKKAVKN